MPSSQESVRARAKHRALIAYEQRNTQQRDESATARSRWGWYVAGSLALILGMLPLVFPGQHRLGAENLANDREVLRQMEQLFPNQIDAVVQRNGKTDLALADSPGVGGAQPLVVVFQRGKESIRVLSYSGHRVCLDLGGKTSCFDLLETPNGGVILEGTDRAWIASQHPVVQGYSVRAQTLEASL